MEFNECHSMRTIRSPIDPIRSDRTNERIHDERVVARRHTSTIDFIHRVVDRRRRTSDAIAIETD